MKHRQGRRGPLTTLATTLAAVAMMGLTVPAAAVAGPGAVPVQAAPEATTDFFSSFEAADPQPAWTNTVETDADGRKKASGVTGSTSTGIPGNVMDEVVAVTASGENTGGGEVKENLVDGDVGTKWLVFARTGWVRFELAEPVAVVRYALTSANDAPGRDPKDWRLQGSQDGQAWTTLDTRTGQVFAERFQTKVYELANATAYRYYRLDVTANSGDPILQLAEVQLSDGDGTRPPSDMRSVVGSGPASAPAAKPMVGFTGLRALRYSGGVTSEAGGYSYNKVFDVDVLVTPATELSYLLFPEFTAADLRYPSTYAAVDLAFTDGTYLNELGAGTSIPPRRARAPRACPRPSTQTSGTTSWPGSVTSRPARPSTASSSATTALRGQPASRAGSTTSGSSAAQSGRRPRGLRTAS